MSFTFTVSSSVPAKTFEDCQTICPAMGEYCRTTVRQYQTAFLRQSTTKNFMAKSYNIEIEYELIIANKEQKSQQIVK